MTITIAGSLGNIGKPLTQKLVAGGHQVTVISSTAARSAAITALGARAAIGSVSDVNFLTTAFTGAEAVFVMIPPNLGGVNVIANTAAAGKAFSEAILNAGVKRVVMLSSIGADLPGGNGQIAGLHQVEQQLAALKEVAVHFLRAGFFYNNLYHDAAKIRNLGILGANYPAAIQIPLVHPSDIAAAAATALEATDTGKKVVYVVSDCRMPAELASVLGTAIGKPQLPWVEFTDEASSEGMLKAGLPEEIAGLYTEMGAGLRSGQITENFLQSGAPVTGLVKLEAFAREFAAAY